MKAWLVLIGTFLVVYFACLMFFHESWGGAFGWALGASLAITKTYAQARRKADQNKDITDVF